MDTAPESMRFSARGAELASFEHAYAVAVQLRRATGRLQFVIGTGDPQQPFRTTSRPPNGNERMFALVA